MATILESPAAAFEARALEHGITQDQLDRLKAKGLIEIDLLYLNTRNQPRR